MEIFLLVAMVGALASIVGWVWLVILGFSEGIGWGLGGLCPGPGLVSAAAGSGSALAFVIAMLVGMALAPRFKPRATSKGIHHAVSPAVRR